jgi:hypothetical protein
MNICSTLESCSFETLGTEAEEEKASKVLQNERLRPRDGA